MRDHAFILVLSRDPNEVEADRLYGAFNDGTIVTVAGVPQVSFHRASESLESAIRSALKDVQSAGFTVERVEIEPATVLQT